MVAKSTTAAENQVRARKTIYPAYMEFARRRGEKPIGIRSFKASLARACQKEGFSVTLGRKGNGRYIEGVKLREDFWDKDYEFGAATPSQDTPVPPEVPKELRSNAKEDLLSLYRDEAGTYVVPVDHMSQHTLTLFRRWSSERHESLDTFMYEKYLSLYSPSTFKAFFDNVARELVNEESFVQSAVTPYMDLSPVTDDAFREQVYNTCTKDAAQITYWGVTPRPTKPWVVPLGFHPRQVAFLLTL